MRKRITDNQPENLCTASDKWPGNEVSKFQVDCPTPFSEDFPALKQKHCNQECRQTAMFVFQYQTEKTNNKNLCPKYLMQT